MRIGRSLSPELSSKSFRDAEIRLKVQCVETKYLPGDFHERAVKRNKTSKEPSTLPHVMKLLCKVLDVSATRSLRTVEDQLL